jgi:hypothetical protein
MSRSDLSNATELLGNANERFHAAGISGRHKSARAVGVLMEPELPNIHEHETGK